MHGEQAMRISQISSTKSWLAQNLKENREKKSYNYKSTEISTSSAKVPQKRKHNKIQETIKKMFKI